MARRIDALCMRVVYAQEQAVGEQRIDRLRKMPHD